MEYFSLLLEIGKLVRGAVNQLRYPCCFNNFVGELAKEEDSLITRRKDVKDRIAHAKKQTRSIAAEVHKWDQDADKHVDDVKKLLNEARTKQNCCFGHCPDWIFRYRSGKKLAKRKTELEKFIEEGRPYVLLERVATLPSGILDSRSEKYLSFGSRQKAYEELMKAVKDDEVGMIGLYGMGGCGKTTMAMEVQKKAEAEHLFDKVLFVPVSNTVEVRRIQDKIASSLQYPFPENEERERAKRLNERLSQESKILVILDDVWQILDFYEIGIPSPKHHKGCKVLITTRSEDVCNSMDCRKKIHLPILDDDEAWTLFGKEANINEDTSDTVKDMARQISDECKGLPVAIAAVASTLKGKDKVIWRDALNKLKSSNRVNIEKGLPDPYNCLELSYHYLDNEEAKSLFLLCSVFPEDYEIPIELLTRCAIGLRVVGEVHSYENARVAVTAAKIKLVNSCLLLNASGGEYECVKMHDLVRDVAHWIAKNENKGIKCEVENDVTLEENSVRYLWCKKLPNDLDCSNLEFLCISTKVEVLDDIFTRMGKLRVLFLKNEIWRYNLPLSTISFKTLTNLRCLILWGWTLSDISFVRYMKKLESLSLNKCSLPSFLDLQKDDAVTQLTKLKLLVLHECEMERNIFEVIGRIPRLEELCIVDTHEEWYGNSENTIEFYKTFSVPQTVLQRYAIVFGSWWYYDLNFHSPPERTLMLSCFDKSNEAIMGLAKKAKTLKIENIKGGAKNIIPNIFELEGGGMPELNELRIEKSKEIECLVDSSNHTSEVVGSLFSSLKILHLYDCPKLRCLLTQAITPNPVRYTIFQNLQEVRVIRCGELKYVFSANTVGGLPQLETLKIKHCDELEEIVEDIIGSVANELEMNEENSSTPSAPLVNHSPGSFTLSKLTRLQLRLCPKLGSLFPASTAKTLISLEELEIDNCPGLKHLLTCERDHNNEKNSVEDDHDLQSVISMFLNLKRLVIERCELLQHIFPVFPVGGQNNIEHNSFPLQHLKTLVIHGCAKLEVIFPVSVVRCLPELERLAIGECKELKHIMEEDENDRIQRELKPCFPKLNEVSVRQCNKLKRLFSASASNDLPYLEKLCIDEAAELEELIGFEQGASNNFQFQHLKTLEITKCAKLEVIFPVSVVRCLPELKCLAITGCEELKHIMEEDENDRIQRELKPCFPKLTVVVVEQCHKLKRLFSASASDDLPNLEVLVINGANEIEQLIGCEQREDEEIRKAKVELPKLKLLILMHLPHLCQGIELHIVKHSIINNCPKLSLTSTTTLQELSANIQDLIAIRDSDFANLGVLLWKLKNWTYEIKESNEVSKSGSTSEFPSSQINEELENEFIGEVHGSEVHATATSTNSELNGRPSLSPLDVCQHEAHSQELVNGQSSCGSYLNDQQKPLGETESTIAIPQNIKIGVEEGTASENAMMVSSHSKSTSSQSDSSQHKSYAREWDSKPENTSPLQMNQEDPSASKSKSPSSQVNDNNQSIPGSIAEMVREHKQIQNEAPVSQTDEFLELERERKMTSNLQSWERKLSFVSSPNMTENIKSVAEEGTISNNTNMAALSMHFKSATSQSGQLVTSQSKSYQHAASKKVITITQKSPIPPTSKYVPLAPITTKVAEPSKPVDKGKKKMVDQPKTAPMPVGEKLMSSAINSAPREKLEIHQVSSIAVGGDNQEPLVENSHDSTAEVTSLLKSPTIAVSATDVEIVEPSIDAEASKANLSMLEDIGESHPSEEVVEETAMKQDPKNDESETSTNPLANPLATYTTPDDSDDEFEEDFKSFDILTEWEQGFIQRAECETFRTSFREKAFNVDILTIASDENLKFEVEEAAAKLLSFGGLVPEKERVRIQMFLDLLDEAVSKVKLEKNQQIQIENIKNTSLDQPDRICEAASQYTSKLSFKENKSELVKLHASEKVLIEKIAALQLKLSSVQIEKQTLESRQNDLRQTIKSSTAHAKSVAEQLKAQLEKISQLETSQVELAESLESLKKKQKTQGQNYFM